MASWGDLNARLNRLVRAGVISGFRTSLPVRPASSGLLVTVSPVPAAPPCRGGLTAADALRARVAAELGPIAFHAAIAIEDGPALESGSGADARNSAETLGP